jgi:hypothetical protein
MQILASLQALEAPVAFEHVEGHQDTKYRVLLVWLYTTCLPLLRQLILFGTVCFVLVFCLWAPILVIKDGNNGFMGC